MCTRKDNFGVLVAPLRCKRQVHTKQYGASTARHVYSCVFIVNPSAYYLGCTHDRKVYDVSEEFPYVFLEVKCPQVEDFNEATCLKVVNGTKTLKRNHSYYYEMMG